jgi:hypothetical protein
MLLKISVLFLSLMIGANFVQAESKPTIKPSKQIRVHGQNKEARKAKREQWRKNHPNKIKQMKQHKKLKGTKKHHKKSTAVKKSSAPIND